MTKEDLIKLVHEAMQNAPHDNKPHRQARAAINAYEQHLLREEERRRQIAQDACKELTQLSEELGLYNDE